MAVFAVSLTAGAHKSAHSAGQTALRCAMTLVVKRLTTCASKASRCSLRSFNISSFSRVVLCLLSRSLFELKRLGFQRFACQRKFYAVFRCLPFDHKRLHGSEERR